MITFVFRKGPVIIYDRGGHQKENGLVTEIIDEGILGHKKLDQVKRWDRGRAKIILYENRNSVKKYHDIFGNKCKNIKIAISIFAKI